MPELNGSYFDETVNLDDSCEQCGLWLCDCDEDALYEDELERTYDGGEA